MVCIKISFFIIQDVTCNFTQNYIELLMNKYNINYCTFYLNLNN